MSAKQAWELVMGLEVHCQLSTKRKLFCDCLNDDQAAPNTHTCPVCLGYPGVLPKLNWEAVSIATKAAFALHCEVREESEFSRKHYFYPDLPKGYQITQFRFPLAENGFVPIGEPTKDGFTHKVVLRRIHMEEDAAKNIHHETTSTVNYNRACVPLIEIVSDPFVGETWHASQYLKHMHWILLDAGVTHGNLEDGHLRCDVNISVRPKGSKELRTRVEVKNLNSFRFIERAIIYERDRQIALYENGKEPSQETRLFDVKKGETRVMRSKEEAMDYRYFPEPDLPVMKLDPAWISQHQYESSVLETKRKLMVEAGADENQITAVMYDLPLLGLFQETLSLGSPPKKVRDWVLTTVTENRKGDTLPINAKQLTELIKLVEDSRVNLRTAKEVLQKVAFSDQSPYDYVKQHGLEMKSSDSDIRPLVESVIKEHEAEWKRFLDGDQKLMGFLMGQVMQKTQGKADPKVASKIIMDLKKEAV